MMSTIKMALTIIGVQFAIALTPNSIQAQEATPIQVVDGLNSPTGVAVQPETGHLFVAESGALRVIRVVGGKVEPVITGFSKDAYGKQPIYDIGPLGLLFLDRDTLMVSCGGRPDGEDQIRVYKIPAQGEEPIPASQMHGTPDELPPLDDMPGEGNFYALAKGTTGVFVTCNGDDEQGWVGLATLDDDNTIASFERKIATVKPAKQKAPTAITMSPNGHVLVGSMGPIEDQPDSRLTFFTEAGLRLDDFPLGIHDVTGLAYGPQHGRLFATDFCWHAPDKGGLYKIVATRDQKGAKPVLLARLKTPTALAFAPSGDLFVTIAGDPNQAAIGKPDGKLIMFKDLDVDLSR